MVSSWLKEKLMQKTVKIGLWCKSLFTTSCQVQVDVEAGPLSEVRCRKWPHGTI